MYLGNDLAGTGFASVPENQSRILEIIVKVSKLKKKGILRRIGAAKGGHWEIE